MFRPNPSPEGRGGRPSLDGRRVRGEETKASPLTRPIGPPSPFGACPSNWIGVGLSGEETVGSEEIGKFRVSPGTI